MSEVFVEAPGILPDPPERLAGDVDDTGEPRPMCRPDTHKDGKHSFVCLAGTWGYTQAPDGMWVRIPRDRLTIPGALWSYTGRAYVRPGDRGVHLEDGTRYEYIEDLPDGDYDVKLVFTRLEDET